MGVRKSTIGMICDNKELFLSLRRALNLSFPKASFYFYDSSPLEGTWIDSVEIPKYKKAGALLALFGQNEGDNNVCGVIKYLRIKGGLQFPLIVCSFAKAEDMERRYDVLTYGGSYYFPIPMDLSALTNLISSAIPMSDGNFRLFYKQYSGRHREFYEGRILPALKRVENIKSDRAEKDNAISTLDKTILELIGNTPITCHERIENQGKINTLSYHLTNGMSRMKIVNNERQMSEELLNMKYLLDCWYELIKDKTLE